MPTNEERIDIAERLRVLASHKAADEELTLDALGLYRGNNIEGFDTHCVMELANLIEPEPERTCKFDSQACGKMRCKRCGAFVSVDSVWDCFGCIPSKYCPNCGAKVVQE